jgi:hypothetical protein
MKISMRMMKGIEVLIGVLFVLTPLTVFAQDGFYVIPVAVNKPLKNVVMVAKANGKFTDPAAAVNSITDASTSNPYLVVIGPGVYTVTSPLQMKPYVDIVGSGNVTKITGALSTDDLSTSAIIKGANSATLSSLTVENTGGGGASIALYNNNASPKLVHVNATASGGTNNYGILNATNSSPAMSHVTATASGGTTNRGVYNASSSPIMEHVNATASGGTLNYGIHNLYYSYPEMIDVTATATGSNGIGICNLASSPLIRRSTMSGGLYGLSSVGSQGDKATVSQSTVVGGSHSDGNATNRCVCCDDGSGYELNPSCNAL